MATSFSFSFGGEDIEDDGEMEIDMQSNVPARTGEIDVKVLMPPLKHDVEDMIASLPSNLSFALYTLPAFGSTPRPLLLPRRELFDIRTQLMAEADVTSPANSAAIMREEAALAAGLSADDIRPGVYEGGFKTWECSVDLAGYATSQISFNGEDERLYFEKKRVRRIVELGAGTALPTCAVLSHLFSKPRQQLEPRLQPKITHHAPLDVVLADYNAHVLALATLPNVFLTTCSSPSFKAFRLRLKASSEKDVDVAGHGEDVSDELEIDPALSSDVSSFLLENGLSLSFVSGSWSGASFVESLLSPASHAPRSESQLGTTLVLASETIYSPSAVRSFADALLDIMRAERGAQQLGEIVEKGDGPAGEAAKAGDVIALVAAKRVYFGVGGGVDDFKHEVRARGAFVEEVWGSEGGAASGVGRCILRVTIA